MPTRVIRDGILTSERIAKLGWPEEVFYRRLMSVVDDHGRFYANPALLLAYCYPLHLKKVSDSDIEKWLTACVNAALVRVYSASDGKRYVEILDFGQRVQSKSKFPACVEQAAAVAPLKLVSNSDLPQSTVVHGDPPQSTALVGVEVGGDKSFRLHFVPTIANSPSVELTLDGGPGPTEGTKPKARRSRVGIPCPAEQLLDLWDEILPEARQPLVSAPDRMASIAARWREMSLHHKWTTKDEGFGWFRKLFEVVRESQFLMGRAPPRERGGKPFRLDVDWFFGPKNFRKVVEGKYHESRR